MAKEKFLSPAFSSAGQEHYPWRFPPKKNRCLLHPFAMVPTWVALRAEAGRGLERSALWWTSEVVPGSQAEIWYCSNQIGVMGKCSTLLPGFRMGLYTRSLGTYTASTTVMPASHQVRIIPHVWFHLISQLRTSWSMVLLQLCRCACTWYKSVFLMLYVYIY